MNLRVANATRLVMVPLGGAQRAALAKIVEERQALFKALGLPSSPALTDSAAQSVLDLGLAALSLRLHQGTPLLCTPPPLRSHRALRAVRVVVGAEQLTAARDLLACLSARTPEGAPSLDQLVKEALALGFAAREEQRKAPPRQHEFSSSIPPITTTLQPRQLRVRQSRPRTARIFRRVRAPRGRRASRRRRPPRGTRDANASDGPHPGALRSLTLVSRRAPW